MKKGDSLSVRTRARSVIDQAHSPVPATGEGVVQIFDGKANVMDARAASREKFRDRRIGRAWLEQLHDLWSGGKASDASTIGILERMLVEAEQITIERKHLVDRAHGDSNVRDARSTTSGGWHENRAPYIV